MATLLPLEAVETMLSKNKLFVLTLLLFILIAAIIAKSDITFRVMVGFDIKPHSQVEDSKITARYMPYEASRTGDDWLIQGFL